MKTIILTSALSFLFCLSAISQDINRLDASGKKNGKWIKKFDNGKTKYNGSFKNGFPIDTFTYYFETGEKRAENIFSQNGKIANNITYYKNGMKMAEGRYNDKKKDGIWKYYIDEKNNRLVSSENYDNGILDGESSTYYPDSGKPAEIIFYKNGRKNGKLIKYFPEGQLMTESQYLNGEPIGDFIHYHPNGQIQITGKYKNGEQVGEWKYFDENGKKIEEEDFKATDIETKEID